MKNKILSLTASLLLLTMLTLPVGAVSVDVAEVFWREFPNREAEILEEKGNGKYRLNLWKANEIVLLEAGVWPGHLSVTDICTCCNPEFLFSHRASHGKRGNLGAFLSLIPEV